MASVETTSLLGENPGAVREEGAKSGTWQPGAIVSDFATLGAGTALAAVFNTLLVFLIPRLVSVQEYGYWRLFLLYAGYVGFLHFGFVDGALLRWAGQTLETIHHDVGPSWKYLILQQAAVILPLCAIIGVVPRVPGHIRIACAEVLVFGLIMNSVTLLQYSLQAARVFAPVAVAAAVPPGAFVALVFVYRLRTTPTANELTVLYGVAWLLILLYLSARVRPRLGSSSESSWSLGKKLTAVGWPVVLANTAFGLVQSADRLVVSSALPIHDFAQYSLAASTMFVPVTAILAISRVFFSHAAPLEHEDRAKIYARVSRLLLVAWSLLLPYFFVLEAFVQRFLPKYISSLPLAGVLLFAVIFVAGIQILHMSYFYLYKRQREFLYLSLSALAMGLFVALAITVRLRSLFAVAAGQVGALAFWWLLNEWTLRRITGQSGRDWLRVFSVVGWSAASFAFTLWSVSRMSLRIPMYYALVACILWFCLGDDLRFSWRLVRASAAGAS